MSPLASSTVLAALHTNSSSFSKLTRCV